MKIKLFNRRGKFCPVLNLGRIVWRCTNGEPNYERQWWLYWNRLFLEPTAKTYGPWLLIPTIALRPWHKSVLASCEPLGISASSFAIDVHFLWWSVGFSIGRTTHTATKENQAVKVWEQ